MSQYFIQPVDPAEIASRFSNEKSIEPLPEMDEEQKSNRLGKIKSALEFLPEKEADYIRLYYFRDKKQVDIAKIFDVTQAAVSYRIKRGKERLKFLLDMPDMDKSEVYDLLIEIFESPRNAKIFREMYETSCQTEVANRLGLGQGCVRHRFLKNLRYLGDILIEKYQNWISKFDENLKPSKVELMEDKLDRLSYESNSKDYEVEDEEFEDTLFEIINLYDSINEDEIEIDKDSDVEEFSSIYEVFVNIRHNFNILREVQLPEWSNGPTKKIS